MKYIKYIIAALALTLTACSSDPDDYQVESDPSISVSSYYVTFTADGGTETVAVATYDGKDFNTEGGADWLTVETLDNAVRFTATPNSTTEAQKCTVKVIAGNGSRTAEKEISVMILAGGNTTVDLSTDGTANSYIARTAGEYSFYATVKGNGKSDGDGNTNYIASHGLEISGITWADLLWEATFDGDRTRSADIIDGAPVYRDGRIHFKTGTVEGNALIAAKNAAGDILWSWHIWVTNDKIEEKEANGNIWMDRNLGALNNEPGDINNRGMFYQWGRKDPFLPTYEPYDQNLLQSDYQDFNLQTGNGSSVWNYNKYVAQLLIEAPGNLPHSVKNPSTFFLNNGGSFSDWYIALYSSPAMNSNLWGDNTNGIEKTIFDPCPPGYTVPPGNCWDIADQSNEWTAAEYGKYWTAGTGDYFPFVGRVRGAYGLLISCGGIGYYWTRTIPLNSTMATRIRIIGIGQTVAVEERSLGQSVRCIRE